jgi:DNA-binding transcriptional LysR family regulator
MYSGPPPLEPLPSLRQLHCFRVAADCGSISRAADEVGLSQPAVSDALTRLEETMGAPLLVRHIAGSALSPAGEQFALRVRRLFARLEQGLTALEGERHGADRLLAKLRLVHVRALIAIAETGSFARAAEHLGVSAPALHRSARELEKLAGRDLYRVGPAGIGVNRAGEALARQMRLALAELTQARDEIGRFAQGARVTVGMLPLVPKRWAARAVAATRRQFPGAQITLNEGDQASLLTGLRWGGLDLLVGALPPPEADRDLVHEPLFADPYVLVVRKSHPLAGMRRVTLDMLTRHEWVVPSRNLPRRAVIEKLFARLPARPRIWLDTTAPGMMTAALAETDCITLISRTQLLMDGPDDLAVLPVRISDAGRAVGVTTRHDWLPTPVQRAFLDALADTAPADSKRENEKGRL